MRLPVRLPEHHPLQRWLAVGVVALIGSVAGLALWAPVRILGAVRTLDQVFYDSLYRLRPTQSQVNGPIVIVAADDRSIEAIDRDRKVGWPWPRDYWGKMVTYLDSLGAKAIVIDILFDRSSVHNNPTNADDQKFAEA